ncbi:MAG: ATP-binding protein [Candidatus Falkowbacteria bacterium]
MERRLIKQILLDQQNEIKIIFKEKVIVKREIEEQVQKALKSPLIKIITGVRRSGKSFLSLKVLSEKKFGYVNFDDERLAGADTKDLNDFLEVLQEINPDLEYLFFDEIQNIYGWELFVNRLKRSGYNILITGSNSKLLSKELATHLTGRHLLLELYPFSFKEFLSYKNIEIKDNDFYITGKRAQIKRLLGEYLNNGGFAETFKIDQKKQYLRDLYDKIITRDIALRRKIKHLKSLKEIALYLISNFGSNITYHKLKNIFEIKSVHTVKNYVDYLEETYLIFQLNPFSFKLKEVIKGSRKIYGIDTGLVNSISAISSPNTGRIMENAVFLELKRKNKEIYFYNTSTGGEIDFAVKEKRKISQLIQVCFDLSDVNTKAREIKSLIKASKELKCDNLLIITDDFEHEEKISSKKIKYVPLWKWLLEN